MGPEVASQHSSPGKDKRNETKQQRQMIEHDHFEQVVAGPADYDLTMPDCIKNVVFAYPVVAFSQVFLSTLLLCIGSPSFILRTDWVC